VLIIPIPSNDHTPLTPAEKIYIQEELDGARELYCEEVKKLLKNLVLFAEQYKSARTCVINMNITMHSKEGQWEE
jgi:hypothetical protein